MRSGRYRSARARGFSLVELIIFIVVVSVLSLALFGTFSTLLGKTPTASALTIAEQLAQQRMELILRQRATTGFAAFTDPCPGPALCTPPAGFAVNAVISPDWLGDTNYRVITITVSGRGDAVLSTLAANY